MFFYVWLPTQSAVSRSVHGVRRRFILPAAARTPWSGQAACPPVPQLAGTRVVSPWFLCTKHFMFHTYLYIRFGVDMFSFLSGRENGIAEAYYKFIFNFLRNCWTVFQSGRTISHSHQQCRRRPVSPRPGPSRCEVVRQPRWFGLRFPGGW